MNRKITKTLLVMLTVAGVFLLFQPALLAGGNKELMSEKMAKQDLKRNLMEMVIGYRVLSNSDFGLTQEAKYQIKEKAAALIKGIKIDELIYDRDKDIAFCMGHIDLGEVLTAAGDVKRYRNVTVHSIGFGTMTPAAKPPLMALRAALLNAYDEMAATLVGERISSYSEAQNFILTKDINKAQVCAAVYGAYIPNPEVNNPDRGWGWDKNGNAFVKLQLDARRVRDILGQRLIYKGPNIIEVIGRGAQVDEVAQERAAQGAGSMVRPNAEKTKYQSLDVPVQQNERKGEPATTYQGPETLEGGGTSGGTN